MKNSDASGKHNRAWRIYQRVRGVGIRRQLVLGFTVFVLICLLIVWFFQVFMLDYIYEKTKLSELDDVLSGIEMNINNPELDDFCSDLAVSHDVCISIYEVDQGSLGGRIVSKDVSPTCIIHYVDEQTLDSYCEQTIRSGGSWTKRYSLRRKSSDHMGEQDIVPEVEKIEDDNKAKGRRVVVAVSSRILENDYGDQFAVFINICFTPVSAIHQTRTMQFAYITFGMVTAAAMFAWYFSKKISKPLERMTVAAEQVACGDLSQTFKEEGYLETRRLAKTLNYAVKEISKTDNLRKELIANVSHDLRTPLTLIAGYAEMMRDIPGENTPENSQHIIDESRRLSSLVNDMLDYSKYSSGILLPDFTVFNFTQSIRSTMNRYSELLKKEGFYIEFKYSEEIFVKADESMILQVIYNLLSNAINYTGEDKTVLIEQELKDGKVRLSVTDTGVGIAPEDIPFIWDRYYKVDKTHRRATAGSGLGLSIVRALLQLHSASFGVESTRDVGSSFWFELDVFEQ